MSVKGALCAVRHGCSGQSYLGALVDVGGTDLGALVDVGGTDLGAPVDVSWD